MALSWNSAKGIVDVVAADVCCQAVINDPLAWGGSFWLAGTIRNLALILGQVDKNDLDRISCIGISMTTAEVLQAALTRGSAGMKAKLSNVRNVSTCGRISSYGVHHHATWIVMKDMTEYVFDWHPTLNTRNPIISRRADWGRCRGEVEFSRFPRAGWA
jgi:hypothetical protein